MTQKQKMLGGVAALVVVLLFVFLYSQFSSSPESVNNLSVGGTGNMGAIDAQPDGGTIPTADTPATPDAAVDAIIDEATLDEASMNNEVLGEQESIKASGEQINNLTQTYDETQL